MAAHIDLEPRVPVDIDRLMAFVGSWPWGRPAERRDEIWATMDEIAATPTHSSVVVRRRHDGIELRRRNVRQFVVIYHYEPPSVANPSGIVSIRAVRHARVKDVFRGVREIAAAPYAGSAA